MGKKFRELNKALKENPCRALLIVNDLEIRKRAFADVFKLIKKIDKQESSLQRYYGEDQKIFQNWYELSFREILDEVESQNDKYVNLVRFHNSIIAEAQMNDISVPDAYRRIRAEESQQLNGTAEVREAINKKQKAREDFAQTEVEKEQEEFGSDSVFAEEAQLKKEFESLSNNQIKKIFENSEAGMAYLSEALSLVAMTGDSSIFLKFWSFATKRIQADFAHVFKKIMGHSIDDFIREAQVDREEKQEQVFEEDYVHMKSRHHENKSVTPQTAAKIKTLYRRLVRRLHPDTTNEAFQEGSWTAKMWEKVQRAYSSKNVNELEKLSLLCTLRTNDLSAIALSEAGKISQFLQSELFELEDQIKHLKKMPAWGFSIKEDHSKIFKKISLEIQSDVQRIQTEIDRLESLHKELDYLTRHRTTPPSRHRARQAPQSKSGQRSFFD